MMKLCFVKRVRTFVTKYFCSFYLRVLWNDIHKLTDVSLHQPKHRMLVPRGSIWDRQLPIYIIVEMPKSRQMRRRCHVMINVSRMQSPGKWAGFVMV